MSALTTKSAVYILARTFPGTEILIWAGAFMTCFPIFYAVIVNDMRRVLAYSLINQVGFMVCGIGIGTHWPSTAWWPMPFATSSTRRCCSCPPGRCST